MFGSKFAAALAEIQEGNEEEVIQVATIPPAPPINKT
jgi:hypothetical protein